MVGTIPLIRAGAMAPFLSWMRANGSPVETLLHDTGLASFKVDDPYQPIPLLSLFRFACLASRIEGPDLPARVVTPSSLSEMGIIGAIAHGGDTVRDALTAVMTALSYHITHEMISIKPVQGGAILREAWGLRLDGETRHFAQQYVAALIQSLCDPGTTSRPVFSRMALEPHPVHGVAHLRPHFGEHIEVAQDRALKVQIPDSILDRPCRPARAGLPGDMPRTLTALPHGKNSLIPSARVVVAELLDHGTPTIQQLACAAGKSVRTLQRRLAEEGTTFSRLLEDARRDRALTGLAGGHSSASDISTMLGYKCQSSLTRAVRRWSGATPRSMRAKTAWGGEVS